MTSFSVRGFQEGGGWPDEGGRRGGKRGWLRKLRRSTLASRGPGLRDLSDLGCLAMREHEVALRAESLRRGRGPAAPRGFCFLYSTQGLGVCEVMPPPGRRSPHGVAASAHPAAGASPPPRFADVEAAAQDGGEQKLSRPPFPGFQRH